jgi:uncharacterized membrane protein
MSRKTYGLVALIGGIAGFFTFGLGSVVGLIFAILGKRLPDDGDEQTTKFLKIGFILSIISLAIGLVCTISCFACGGICSCGADSLLDNLEYYY